MPKRLLPDTELDSLIQKLNTSAKEIPAEAVDEDDSPLVTAPFAPRQRWRLPAPTAEGRDRLAAVMASTREAPASDLLIVAGTRPTARVNGSLLHGR